jgi:hypothetical protein
MIFAINESNMTAAFWDYLKGYIENKYSKKDSIKKLSEYIKKIKEI